MRRVPGIRVRSIESVLEAVAGFDDHLVVLLDVDNTIVEYDADPLEVSDAIERATRALRSMTSVDRVLVVSNAGDRGRDDVLGHARKPFTSPDSIGLASGDSVVVIGDQILTDGLLAWRLGGTYVHAPMSDHSEPVWPALQRAVGQFIEPIFFEWRRS